MPVVVVVAVLVVVLQDAKRRTSGLKHQPMPTVRLDDLVRAYKVVTMAQEEVVCFFVMGAVQRT